MSMSVIKYVVLRNKDSKPIIAQNFKFLQQDLSIYRNEHLYGCKTLWQQRSFKIDEYRIWGL